MSLRRRARPVCAGDDGFTLVEMIVTIALSGIIMTAVAGGLVGGLRALAVQKARTQGNEVATLGIESLQGLSYDTLGMCAPAADPPPGLTTPATPAAGCPVGFLANGGEDPCRSTPEVAGTEGFTRSVYPCVRNNVTYNVRRYIAWDDVAQTSKRLAVFVTWTDTVGPHEVSQQSSLRAPGAEDIAGLPTPQITSVVVNPTSVVLNPDGTLQGDVILQATTSGLAAAASPATRDKVYASFQVLDATDTRETVAVFLESNSGTGTSWDGVIPAGFGYRFGNGSQFLTFSTIRDEDGKGNSFISPKVTFSGAAVSATPAPDLIAFDVTPTSDPPNVKIYPSGGLIPSGITLTATTIDATASDIVDVVFPTRAGAVTSRLRATSCTGNVCDWVGEIAQESGYAFSAGSKTFTFTVSQVFTGPGTGSTDAEQETVVFEV